MKLIKTKIKKVDMGNEYTKYYDCPCKVKEPFYIVELTQEEYEHMLHLHDEKDVPIFFCESEPTSKKK